MATVVAVLLLLPALGLILGGGLLLWADGPARDDDGYLYSAEDSFSTARSWPLRRAWSMPSRCFSADSYLRK